MGAWRVIGESLLVREEADLKSPERGRLSYGAVLLQKDLRGERLGFQLLRGAGPLEGYVSLRIKGKELVERCEKLDPPETHVPQVSMEVDMPRDCMVSAFNFQRVANFRDLAAKVPQLRPGKLFRSGHFAAALDEDLERLDSLGIRTYVDLRDGLDFEGADAPVYDMFPPSPRHTSTAATQPAGQRRRIWCPFSKDLKMRAWAAEEKHGLVPQSDRRAWNAWWYQRYVRVVLEKKVEVSSASNLSAINRAILFVNSDEVLKAMKALSEEENYPVVFGCVAGKDRTGLLACLVLSALGIDKETIMADYVQTNLAAEHIDACNQVGFALWWKQLEAEDPRRFNMLQKSGQVGQPLGYDVTWPGLAGGRKPGSVVTPAVFPATMAYTLQVLEEEGGPLAYLESIGFGPEEVLKLRKILLD